MNKLYFISFFLNNIFLLSQPKLKVNQKYQGPDLQHQQPHHDLGQQKQKDVQGWRELMFTWCLDLDLILVKESQDQKKQLPRKYYVTWEKCRSLGFVERWPLISASPPLNHLCLLDSIGLSNKAFPFTLMVIKILLIIVFYGVFFLFLL